MTMSHGSGRSRPGARTHREEITKFVHQASLEKYARLLKTHLTDTERAFVRRRIAEERTALAQLCHRSRLAESHVGKPVSGTNQGFSRLGGAR